MKKVTFEGRRPSIRQAGSVDDWVENKEAEPRAAEPPPEETKRLTIDVPLNLHRRIKSQCAIENLIMAEVIRELLERRFPAEAKREARS